MLHQVNCLNGLAMGYDDWWYIIEKLNGVMPRQMALRMFGSPEGALINYRGYRRFLLQLHQKPKPVDLDRFLPATNYPDKNAIVNSIAMPLAAWNLHSRRVYRISDELQAILSKTSLHGALWGDLHLPFKSFAVALPMPIYFAEEDRSYDFVIICTMDDDFQTRVSKGLWVYFYSTECSTYKSISMKHRSRIDALAAKGQRSAQNLVAACQPELDRSDKMRTLISHFSADSLADAPVSDMTRHALKVAGMESALSEQKIEFADSILRLVFGMVLYMRTLKPKNSQLLESSAPLTLGLRDNRALHEEMQICDVSSNYQLTRDERIMLGLEGTAEERRHFEMSWHFVEGYWRRPPGYGHDPDCERTVQVRPYMVRTDRMPPEAGLPGGAIQTL